jgi:hypothetical protein
MTWLIGYVIVAALLLVAAGAMDFGPPEDVAPAAVLWPILVPVVAVWLAACLLYGVGEFLASRWGRR